MPKKIIVSVIVVSYNHAESIKRAVDSVLEQTLKDYEIIIVDDGSTDGSTDGSVDIIKNFERSNEKIKAYFENHKGLMNTYLKAFSECSGKYVTFCDCDDYWIDKDKLKKQFEYMENNSDCGLCFTKVYTEVDEKCLPMSISVNDINNRMSFDSLLSGRASIHAQSYMIRKSVFDKHINFQYFVDKGFHVWDYPIVLELIKHTWFHCLNFYSAVWVKSVESVTSTIGRERRIKYLLGNYKIKWYYIKKYSCKLMTKFYLIYRIMRDVYSVCFLRWNKEI